MPIEVTQFESANLKKQNSQLLQGDSDRRYMMAEDELLEPIDFTLATPVTAAIPVALRDLI